jgi:hypothetical protein
VFHKFHKHNATQGETVTATSQQQEEKEQELVEEHRQQMSKDVNRMHEKS